MLTITVTTTIARPVDVVREEFSDLDHAIRDRVHKRFKLKWLTPKHPNERRFLQQMRILGVVQSNEVVLEITQAGDLVRRFVEGPNKGLIVTEVFSRQDDNSTLVTATATLPTEGLIRAMSPLLKTTIRKILENALLEHKEDLEGGYVPGKARGNILAALSPLYDLSQRALKLSSDAERLALITPLLESACATAVANDVVDDPEREAIHTVVSAMGIVSLESDAIDALIASSVDQTKASGIEQRCIDLGERLKTRGVAAEGLCVAALVAQISHGIDQSELAILENLASHAGVSLDELAVLIEEVDRALSLPPIT